MEIKTRFDIGDTVLIIHDNQIVSCKVNNISYYNGIVNYELLIHKSLTMMDRDITTLREEANVSKEFEELKNIL
jgi:hypothetical protein